MVDIILPLTIAAWYVFGFYRLQPRVHAAPLRGSYVIPLVLVAWSLLPPLFKLTRNDPLGRLNEGFTVSNLPTIAPLGLTALYIAFRFCYDSEARKILFYPPTLAFLWVIIFYALSSLWSVVPLYTAYRSIELFVFFFACVMIFDGVNFQKRFLATFFSYLVFWLLIESKIITQSLSQGIVVSAAKNNDVPLVCVTLLLFTLMFFRHEKFSALIVIVAVIGFIVAGSAAATAVVLVIPIAFLIASDRLGRRWLGIASLVAYTGVFFGLVFGLKNLPWLVDLISSILQKPAEELTNATGRLQLWSVFYDATRDRLFGSGFAAADRFIDLIIGTDEFIRRYGTSVQSFIAHAENTFLIAWVGTGWIGMCGVALAIATTAREAAKLSFWDRGFALSVLLLLLFNGFTVAGAFGPFGLHVAIWASLLGFIHTRRAQSLGN